MNKTYKYKQLLGVYEYNTRFSRQNSKTNSPALGGLRPGNYKSSIF
jgi:hypothetical protein